MQGRRYPSSIGPIDQKRVDRAQRDIKRYRKYLQFLKHNDITLTEESPEDLKLTDLRLFQNALIALMVLKKGKAEGILPTK